MNYYILTSVVAAILLFILALLFLPISVIFKNTDNESSPVYFRVLGIDIARKKKSPTEKKQNNEKKQKSNPFIKRIIDLDAIREEIKTDPVGRTIERFFDLLTAVLKSVFYLLGSFTIPKLELRIVVASDNAAKTAIEYGAISAVTGSFLSFISSKAKVKPRGRNIDLRCDYSKEKSEILFDIVIRTKVLSIIRALLILLKETKEREIFNER